MTALGAPFVCLLLDCRLQRQRGVVRTNCFDSLDRTNLLQYQARQTCMHFAQEAEVSLQLGKSHNAVTALSTQVAWRWLQAQLPTFQSPISSGQWHQRKDKCDAVTT